MPKQKIEKNAVSSIQPFSTYALHHVGAVIALAALLLLTSYQMPSAPSQGNVLGAVAYAETTAGSPVFSTDLPTTAWCGAVSRVTGESFCIGSLDIIGPSISIER